MTFRLKPLALLPLLFAALFSCTLDARADTVVLTGGTVVTDLQGSQAHIQGISGSNFFLNAPTVGPYTSSNCTNAQPCAPGQTVDWSRTINVQFMGGPATATLNGTQYTNLALQGSVLNFSTGPITLQDLAPSTTLQSYEITVPFTVSGTIIASGFVNGQSDGNTLFTVDVAGGGLATLRVLQSGSSVFITSATFNFQPQPTPEPATLVLLGTGIAGLAARTRRRRARK